MRHDCWDNRRRGHRRWVCRVCGRAIKLEVRTLLDHAVCRRCRKPVYWQARTVVGSDWTGRGQTRYIMRDQSTDMEHVCALPDEQRASA